MIKRKKKGVTAKMETATPFCMEMIKAMSLDAHSLLLCALLVLIVWISCDFRLILGL